MSSQTSRTRTSDAADDIEQQAMAKPWELEDICESLAPKTPKSWVMCGGCCACCALPLLIFLIVLLASITELGPEEQLIYTSDTGEKEAVNGPASFVKNPFRSSERRSATRLNPLQYAQVKHTRTEILRHVEGPLLLFLGPWEEVIAVHSKIVLQAREYTRLVDSFTGEVRIEVGPCRIVPGVFESNPDGVQIAVPVRNADSVVVLNRTSGLLRTYQTEGFFIPGPFDEIAEVRQATVLQEMEYAVVRSTRTGMYRHEVGPQRLKVGAYDEVVRVMPKIVLQKQEYVRLVDEFTGYARIVAGPALIEPEPSEDGPGGIDHVVQQSIIISSQVSVVLLNRTSGVKYEVRTEGMFTPGPYEDVLEVRRATVLKSQEYAVVRNDLTGTFAHYPGPQQLFVGPYEQLVKVLLKVVLQQQEYVRLVDRRTGEENIVKGAQTVVPEPTECEKDYVRNCTMTVENAIVLKADLAVLVLNKTSGVRSVIRNDASGIFTPRPYEEVLEVRQATVLTEQQYAVIKSNLDGSYRHALGPQLLNIDAMEQLMYVTLKVVLYNFQYIRLLHEQTGVERVVKGPEVFVPDPLEVSIVGGNRSKMHHEMVQDSILVDAEHALLVLNQATGEQQLVTQEGMWSPAPHEHFVEKRPLLRVQANDAVVVRDYDGHLTIYDGTAGGAGTSFFLQPRSSIATMTWSDYGMPEEDGTAAVSQVSVDKIDMRIQRTFYSYTVRTNDNVQLQLMGTLFWRVTNISRMILGTSDPVGDVWHHSRSSFIQAVSNTTFDSFMSSFNRLATDAYKRDTADGFYSERGVALLSMEVTRFDAVDDETRHTLQQINEETTNQMTELKRQEGENAVRAAKMRSDIVLEQEQTNAELNLEIQKTELVRTRAENNLIAKQLDAESDAQPFAQHAKSFISALNHTGVDIASSVELYRTLREAEHHNTDTHNLASGQAKLLLTSDDVNLHVRDFNLGSDSSTSYNGQHYHDDDTPNHDL